MSGVLWAAISGVGFGLFQTVNRRAGRDMNAFQATFILLLVSAVILTIASLVTEDLNLLREARPSALANFGLAGLTHFFVGWTLLSMSQKRVGAARTGALVGASPLFATAIAALMLHEFLSLPALVGIVLVFAGVYLVSNG